MSTFQLVKEIFSVKKATFAQLSEIAKETLKEGESLDSAIAALVEKGGYKKVVTNEADPVSGEIKEVAVTNKAGAELFVRTKGLEAEIQNPANYLISQIADISQPVRNLLENSIYSTIRDFVRSQYIDNFLPVGDHSLEYIADWIEKNSRGKGGTAALKLTRNDYKLAVELFKGWFSQPMPNGSTRAANQITAFEACAVGKFSHASFIRALGPDNCNETMVQKVILLLTNFAEAVAELDGLSEDQSNAVTAAAFVWIENLEEIIKELTTPKVVDLFDGI